MNMQDIKRYFTACVVTIAATLAFNTASAATATIAGQNASEMVQQVQGTYVYNTRISFDEPGAYKVTLTDFKFPGTFDAVGVMISSAKQKIVEVISYDHEGNLSKLFSADAGDYYLSLFAVSDRQWNLGRFGLAFEAADPSDVPLPPALVLLMSGAMTLMAFVRRRQGVHAVQ